MITDIIDRLATRFRAEQPATHVLAAADFARAEATSLEHGDAVYVIPLTESAPRADTLSGPLRQLVSTEVGVLIHHVDHAGDRRGERAADGVSSIRRIVRAALLGWTAKQSKATPLQFVRGELQLAEAGAVSWLDVYRTEVLISAEAAAR